MHLWEPVEAPLCLMLCVALPFAILLPSLNPQLPLFQEEKGLEFFTDTFSELGAEAPNCIPQIPSTPHFKASVQDKKKEWPQTNSVSGTHFQPK